MKWLIGVTGVFVLLVLPSLASPVLSVDSLRLLLAIQEGPGSGSFDPTVDRPTQESPEWPVHTFLVAEYFHQRGQWRRAQVEYRRLVDWSVADGCGDERGGSGLAGIALWRLLQGKPEKIAQDEQRAEYLFQQGEKLLGKTVVRQLFRVPGLKTRLVLARFEDEIFRKLVAMAMQLEDRERATRLLMKGLKARTTGEFSLMEKMLLQWAADEGKATDRVLLRLARRLMRLGEYDSAGRWLETLVESGGTAKLRTEAGLELAELRKFQRRPGTEIIALLDEVVRGMDDTVPSTTQQEVLWKRALRHNREGFGRDVSRAREDFETIRRRFPEGSRADDALYEIARTYEFAGQVRRALSHYNKLKILTKGNSWRDSMHFRPALLYYMLGGQENLAKAKAELEVLEKRVPRSALYIHALFWLGRVHEELDDEKSAHEYFRRIVDTRGDRIDYYAIRARMHLNAGKRASKLLFPDEVTERELNGMYVQSSRSLRDRDVLKKGCPYGGRVSWAVWTGLYAKALEGGQQRLTRRGVLVRQRHDPSFLDRIGALASVAIHVALQQDAVAAVHNRGGEARARYAWQLTQAGDLDGATAVLSGKGKWDEWISVAYPPVYARLLRDSGREYGVPPELLYGVIRQESRFSPVAVSPFGALGLFQFLPSTFKELNRRWSLLDDTRVDALEGYLSEPNASVELGARWFQDLLRRRTGTGEGAREMLALMEHQAGPEAVDAWLGQWKGKEDDIEFLVESPRFGETRKFLRNVLPVMAITRAAGMFSQADG